MGEQRDTGDPDMLTVKEVCETLKISKWMVYELMRSGQLTSVTIGRRRLVPRHSLKEYEQRLEGDEGGVGGGGQTR
jgi:excisionase family DNA binding protein